MRLQELHPALVHLPIALLPTTLAVDALGRVSGNATLLEAGKRGIAIAAAGAAVAALAGLLAQEASRYDGDGRDLVITHRNLNLGLVGLTAWMATRRAGRRRPSLRYLLAGLGGLGVMSYSAYLGGKMVYEHGVGVKEAGGLREEEAPELVPSEAGRIARIAGRHVVRGLSNAVADLARGQVFPWLTRSRDGSPSLAQAGSAEPGGRLPEDRPVSRTI